MPRPQLITFDCYGTLIDWHGGLCRALADLDAPGADLDQLAERYVELEMELEDGPYLPYREVMARTLELLMEEANLRLPDGRRDILGDSLPGWKPFPEVPGTLEQLSSVCPLAILSNIDDDLLESSVRKLGVSFAHRVTAAQVRSYKPKPAHFERIRSIAGRSPREILHVGASLLHDMVPAAELGIPHLWVNRRGEEVPDWMAGRVLTDLAGLPAFVSRIEG